MPQPHTIISGTREAHHEPGSVRWMIFHFDPTSVQIDDAMDGGEP